MPNRSHDSAIAQDNLALFDTRLMHEAEKRLAVHADFAEMCADLFLADSGRNLSDLLAETGAAFIPRNLPSDAPLFHTDYLSAMRNALFALDRVSFLSAFRLACAKRGCTLDHTLFLPKEDAPLHRIAYVRNPYTEEAYEIFTREDGEATLLYTDGFSEACQAVTDGQADFCILPFENSSGPLGSFQDMAARFSLTVTALCRVFHTDGTDATRFALLSKKPLPSRGGDMPCIRFSFSVEDGGILAEHLTALSACGATVTSLSSLPDTIGKTSLSCTLTLRCTREDAFLPLAYLYTFTDFPRLLGFYEEIEE